MHQTLEKLTQTPEPGLPDLLSEAASLVRLSSRSYERRALERPWERRLPGEVAHVHVVEQGSAVLRHNSLALALAEGDLVVVLSGEHRLVSSPRLPAAQGRDRGGTRAAPPDILVDCTFQMTGLAARALFGHLPPVLSVPAGPEGAPPWLRSTAAVLRDEAREAKPGHQMVISRILDVVFLMSLRTFLERSPAGLGTWLSALRDPMVGRALAQLHAAPARAWTVSSLARAVGTSRTRLAARFVTEVGESPMAHLARLRLTVASELLRADSASLQEVAERVGYRSDVAFLRAFKRLFGVTPARYRRGARP